MATPPPTKKRRAARRKPGDAPEHVVPTLTPGGVQVPGGRVELEEPGSLVPWKDNPRINEAASFEVQRAIERFGFLDPLIARRANREIIAGHTRHLAAVRMGLERVPVIWLDVDEDEAHRLAVYHNRVGERAEWDPLRLVELAEGGLVLTDVGFSELEVEDLYASLEGAEEGGRSKVAEGLASAKEKAPRRLTVTLHLYTDEADELEGLIERAAKPGEVRAATFLRALAELAKGGGDGK